MTISELESKLLAEGCNKHRFAIGARGMADDAFCLVQKNGKWEVFYTERGCDSSPIFSAESETEACAFFYRHILSLEHWHIVGSFLDEADAVKLEARVRELGAVPIRNDVKCFTGKRDDRYRVFVVGKDIFPVRNGILGVPLGINWKGERLSE
ncbi:MAG: hypothetical protein PHD76_14090 [Methylacidiphilales bacterium]|nr:hypothetical protein [Candidatus Methylacidiphilales bacterium]